MFLKNEHNLVWCILDIYALHKRNVLTSKNPKTIISEKKEAPKWVTEVKWMLWETRCNALTVLISPQARERSWQEASTGPWMAAASLVSALPNFPAPLHQPSAFPHPAPAGLLQDSPGSGVASLLPFPTFFSLHHTSLACGLLRVLFLNHSSGKYSEG